MGVPSIVYEWKSLRTLYIAVFLMNIIGCAIMVVLVTTAAAKLRSSGMRDYLDLAVPGAAFFWPWTMILTAFFCAAIYAIGFKICLRLKSANAESSLRLNDLLLTHCALCFLSAILEIGLAGLWVHQVMNIDRRLETGIWESMRDYPTDLAAKTKVDTMQLELSCCGSESFEDWLDLGWLQAHEITGERNESPTASSRGVPFSCCLTETLAPCVHHGVDVPNDLYNLDRRLTISRTGCRAKLLTQTLHYGGLMILAFISLSTYQMILAVLSRLLQTAHSNALSIGPARSRYLAWIFGSSPSSEKYNRLLGPEQAAKIPFHRPPSKGPKDNCPGDTADTPLQNSPFPTPSATGVFDEQGGSSCCRASAEANEKNLTNGTGTKIPTPPPSSGIFRESCAPGNEIPSAVKSTQFRVTGPNYKAENSTRDWGGPTEELSHFSTGCDQVRLDCSRNYPKEDLQLQRLRTSRKDLSPEYEAESDVRCSWSRDADMGQRVGNGICSCGFDPADTYSRFHGSLRDTVTRRNCQIVPPTGPALIALPPMDRRRCLVPAGISHRSCRQLCPRQRHLLHPYEGNDYHHPHNGTGGGHSFKNVHFRG